ncbi:redoxin domain-containing protein [Parvularcula maris]|uniref:Redoxin domain-containing protein n=1 Tax=Parvularcula maris TaxID=2965077 RepID=A0A9X2L9L3_9PROT|nr:redoxin domain-containing protein [Parvularcula maris]MCQ8185458.1 redoxin domain-containing protein [Parvularcula maris]
MFLAAIMALLMGAELGPAVGSTIPEAERFEAMMGEEGATIVFVRSVDWCPFCKKQVTELSEVKAEFAEEGQPLIFVSYDAAAKQAAFQKRSEIEGNFIADEGSELIMAFGLLNESHRPGSRAYGIPHPAVIVVDENGVVEAKLYEEDYTTNAKSYRNRPAVETILEAVKAE